MKLSHAVLHVQLLDTAEVAPLNGHDDQAGRSSCKVHLRRGTPLERFPFALNRAGGVNVALLG